MARPSEEEDSSCADRSHRLSRLEHILGGKCRRASNTFTEYAALSEDGKPAKEAKPSNINDQVVRDEMMLEASTSSCVSEMQCDDLGLEIAMKQLMEATHDALVNMKGEILRMQYDLERALVEISLLQQREDLLQQQFQGKALELETEFSKRLEDLRQTMFLEFTMCKQESEQRILGKLESLLDEMREIQRNGGKEILKPKVDDLQQRRHQRAVLTQEMLQRISPKRFEQSAAVVRGWLESPTPSESSSASPADRNSRTCNTKRLCNIPTPNLVSSMKEEAKLAATHHRAFTPTQAKVPEIPAECGESRINLHHQHAAEPITDLRSEPRMSLAMTSNGRMQLQPLNQYKENAWTHDSQMPTKPLGIAVSNQKKEIAAAHKDQKMTHEGRPALRILKPNNFKISDLLFSDSEEELGSSRQQN
ncbi:hypothetical protein KP509_28G016200 [Ceratopteris richardii]|uniref:Uncharacterized protein n=1 Tax=Ceratopteris richardii TaxID=49495 RepID=A0A8T2RBK6_CERRI|nr:hypothetical protein KP509_28G016200 [Ceratopteris richardii]